MHLPARADGGPHQPIAPGATWSPTWTIDQPAATFWYHPHPHGETEDHVYRGLSGLFLIDDPQGRALPLSKRYGVDDLPVIIQDKRFRADGSLGGGKLGTDILINGTYDPHVDVGTQLVRFRLLNASSARSYDVGFTDDRAFDLIATDGGLLDVPYHLNRVPLSPGERAEIVAAFEPGERVALRSFQPDLGENFLPARFDGGDDTFDLLQVRAAGRLRGSAAVPARLAHHDVLNEAGAATTRRIRITSSSSIDGKSMDMSRIDQVVTVGTTEIWEVRNQTGSLHNFHVHDVQFKVLAWRGGPPPPYLAGWKDTVALPPGQSVRFLTRFSDYADPSTPYMFHCHLLRHEDEGSWASSSSCSRPRPPGSRRRTSTRADPPWSPSSCGGARLDALWGGTQESETISGFPPAPGRRGGGLRRQRDRSRPDPAYHRVDRQDLHPLDDRGHPADHRRRAVAHGIDGPRGRRAPPLLVAATWLLG